MHIIIMDAYIVTLLMAKDIFIIVSARPSSPGIDSGVIIIHLLVLVPVIAKAMLLSSHVS
jgi:hypothetical protein